jgi:hypothetical protein
MYIVIKTESKVLNVFLNIIRYKQDWLRPFSRTTQHGLVKFGENFAKKIRRSENIKGRKGHKLMVSFEGCEP